MDARELKEAGFLKYLRITRRYFLDRYKLSQPDFEILFYLSAIGRFTRKDWEVGIYTYTWDKRRWVRLRRDGWIDVFRNGDRKNGKANIYMLSHKASMMVMRFYRILAGEEDIPMTDRSPYYFEKDYKSKTMTKAIDEMIKDPDR